MISVSFSSPTAPTAPPDKLEVIHNDSRSAYLTWDPPPEEHHNGVLTGYPVEVVKQLSVGNLQIVHQEETDANTTEISIPSYSLEPWTAYVFRVSARTAGGVGQQAEIQSTTPEGGIALLFNHTWEGTLSFCLCAYLLYELCVLCVTSLVL